jgi:hypothetical protein
MEGREGADILRRPMPVPALCVLLALGAGPVRSSIDELREEAEAVLRIQSTLDWYTRTLGEPSIKALTYRGHERLFSPESVRLVDRAIKDRKADSDPRRALQFLKSYLASEYLSLHVSRYDDEVANAELQATVSLPWLQGPVPYKELENLIKDEQDAGRRAEIERVRAEVWRNVLNPILAKKEAEVQRLARKLGYRSYVALAEEARLVNLRQLLEEGHRFLLASDPMYAPLLEDIARKELGLEVRQMKRADITRLRNAPRFERFFPRELMQPAFLSFLAGLGLDMKSAAGTAIRVDDAPHPLKEQRAACYSIHVPDDVRITVKPTSGVEDFATFFHEGGHALHFANATTRTWEFQQLGPNALTEAWSEVFGKVWSDPVWLRHYRDFVTRYNAVRGTKIPVMTDDDIAELSRVRVFNDFYYLRRYSYAKIVYESVLHGGDPAIWKGLYDRPTADPMEVYRDVFGRAYGFPLGDEDALRFRTDVDDTFYAADYARAFGLADLIHEALRERYGGKDGNWYDSKEVGALLKSLWADGQKWQPDEIAQKFGQPKLTFGPSTRRAQRLLGVAATDG